MSGDHLKTPFAAAINRFAEGKVNDGLQLTGKSFPASVVSIVSSGIVVCKFELNSSPWTLPNVTVPVAMSEYARLPVQPGCKGVLRAADARLGGVSGLSGGVADLSQPANLTALVFEPIATTVFIDVDTDQLVLYGEPDVLVMDKTGAATVLVSSDGITLTFGDSTVIVNGDGVAINGVLTINGQPYLDHTHSGVETGGADTEGVVV